MIQYPISFYASAKSDFGIQSRWTMESQKIDSLCAIPNEFEGPGGALSPEDLFAQALTNCFIATFKVYAEKSKVHFQEVSVQTELIADIGENRKPVMKTCNFKIHIRGSEYPDRLKTLAEKAFASGFIINSVKTNLNMELRIET